MTDITPTLLQIQAMIFASERAFGLSQGSSDLDLAAVKAAELWYRDALGIIEPLRKEHADDPRVLALERQLCALRWNVDSEFIDEQMELADE